MSDNINYYQTIPEFGIKGRMNTPEEFEKIGMPEDFIGWEILDIGCNIGAFLFEAGRRRADGLFGIEPNFDWRIIAKGLAYECGEEMTIFPDISKVKEADLKFNVVLLLSVLHLDEVENPQGLLDDAWSFVRPGGLLIVEINDRLQRKEVKLPHGAKLFGKNKDGRSVYHCTKGNQ